MRQHTLFWYDIPARLFFESRRIGPGDRLYLRKRSRSGDAASACSVYWDELPEDLTHYLSGLGIFAGDRVYIGKLRKLTDKSLAKAASVENLDDVWSPKVAKELAKRFDRGSRTIQRRLKRLSISVRHASNQPDVPQHPTRRSDRTQLCHLKPVKENS